MRPSTLLLTLATALLPPALIGTTYLYHYPLIIQCAFPTPPSGTLAPFRLLTLADPQLEGDTSVPSARGGLFAKWRKELDLWGNDLYLGHVWRVMRRWSAPTHVVVLGDLLGSQWISGEEFERRRERFWETVMKGGDMVPEDVGEDGVEVLGEDKAWERRVIAVAGNHDVGYAGDVDRGRVERFETGFGRVNWEVRFKLNATDGRDGLAGEALPDGSDPELRLVILNSMNLDSPAYDRDLQRESQAFLNEHLHARPVADSTATILLTHIPLHKEAGICVDGPFFSYFPPDQGGGVKEQNHLSPEVSREILAGLLGPRNERSVILLNGHDHAGCDTWHTSSTSTNATLDRSDEDAMRWRAERYSNTRSNDDRGLREITVRSMMGDFGGNAGLLSAWWDLSSEQWEFQYASCQVGVQHIWWAVHVVDLVFLAVGCAGLLALGMELRAERKARGVKVKDT